jgi:dTDP-4-dehydrorhamnose reductase
MRILLLGADGQVGFELHRTLAPLGTIVPATLNGLMPDRSVCARSDFCDPGALATLIRAAAPDWIFNAAAYTQVDKAEDEPALASKINAGAVALIAEEAKKLDAAVLHYSTDYVFPGAGDVPYPEAATTGPINMYGQSKLAGEQALRDSGARHLILRTAWVYGSRGHNFLLTMLKLAGTRDKLTVVNDQHGTPTSARLLSSITTLAIAKARRDELGTYHATAAGSTTWHGFAQEIVNQSLRAGIIRRAPTVEPIASRDFPTKAKRPTWSVLDCGKLERTFGFELPEWRVGLAACVAELAEQYAARPA